MPAGDAGPAAAKPGVVGVGIGELTDLFEINDCFPRGKCLHPRAQVLVFGIHSSAQSGA